MRLILTLAAAALCAAPAGAQNITPLSAFERELSGAPAVAITAAAVEILRADSAIDRRTRGARLSAGAQAGTFHEQVSDTLARDYQGLTAQVSLREPILGEAAANRDAVLRSSVALAAREADVEIARRTVRRAVRLAYIAYWNAAQRGALAADFQRGGEELQRALALRTQAHLLLQSDALGVGSEYAGARRDGTRSAREAIRARGTLGVALGREVAPFGAAAPVFTGLCAGPDAAVAAAWARSAALVALQAESDAEHRLAETSVSPVSGGVSIGQTIAVQRPAAGGPGRGTTVAVDLSVPVGSVAIVADRRARDRAQAAATDLRIAQARAQLRVDANDAWAGLVQTGDDLRFAQARADAGREGVREAELRYGRIPGDTLEQLTKARWAYYGAAADRLDAQAAQLAAQTEMLFIAGDRCSADASSGVGPSLTVFDWDPAALFDTAAPDVWQRLAAQGITRVLAGFDAHRIATAATPEGRALLNASIAAAGREGIEIDLLLGDPEWMHASSRGGLIDAIHKLRGIAFGGIELDLEPGQLVARGERRADVVRALAQTVAAAAAVSPWPLGINVSYREFLSPDPCLACLLQPLRLREVTLLTYVANPDRAAEIVRPILRAHRALRFSVAESVEAGLSADESYARRGRARFYEATARLDAALRAQPNYAGIRVQALRDLDALAP